MRIDIRGDDEGGWFLDHAGHDRLPHLTAFTGPFETRADAARAIPGYRRTIARALGRG